MLSMDVFRGDAFSAVSLTAAVDRMGYVPGYLGSIPGLVEAKPIRTVDVWIEERSNAPVLIQTSQRGAEPSQKGGERRKARSFRTVRIMDASRIYADELQGIRAFGEETELMQLQAEVARRQFRMKQDFDLTHENMRFGVIQGKVVDADGSVINDWYEEFRKTPLDPFDFKLTPGGVDGDLYKQCNAIRRALMRALQGVGGSGVAIHAIAADDFWDDFVTNQEVRETYKYAMDAKALQNQVGGAWESFRYGNIIWHNYRGTDDNSELAVKSGSARFFPVGAGIFQKAQAPAESFEFVNTLGNDSYTWTVPDLKRNQYEDIEQAAYPLYVCTMPEALGEAQAS